MATGMKVECQNCGQVYGMQKKFDTWPPCPKCKGQLVIQVDADAIVTSPPPAKSSPPPKVASAPIPASAPGSMDVFSQLNANKPGSVDPFASASKTLPSAVPASNSGLPIIAWLFIGGGVLMLGMVILVVVGVFMLRSSPARAVATMPMPAPISPAAPPPNMTPVPGMTPLTPKTSMPNATSGPANSQRDFAKEHEERVAKMKQDHEERVAKMNKDMEAARKKAGFGDSESTTNTGPKTSGTLSSPTGAKGVGFGGSGEQSNFQPRTPWDVKIDPAPAIEYPATEKLLEIDFKTRVDQLVFPDCPSPFFAAANDEFRKQDVRIFDLRTGRSSRKIPGELNNDKNLSALNADGEHMATVIRGGEGTNIVIANTKTGKLVHSIAIDKSSTVKDLAFAGPGRLIAVVEGGRGSDREHRVGVWDLLEGKSIADFALQNPIKDRFNSSWYFYKEGSLAVSPGGKYFLCALSNVLEFYEVATGKLAGQLQISEVQRDLDTPSFAFSPDAKELTVMHGRRAEDAMLFRIDISNGEVIGSAKVNLSEFKETASYYNTLSKLQYIPSIDCYLIDGTYVVERTSGEALFRLDAFGGMACVIEGSRIVGVVKRDNAAGLAEFRLPKDEIEKLAAILKGGGKLLDGIWGEAKTSDLAGAKKLEQPVSATPWNLVLSPAMERLPVKKTITLPVPADRNNSWHVDAPLFSTLGGKIAWLPWSDRSHSRLNVMDVTTGAAEGNLDMLPGSRVLDLSPDGSLVLAALGKKTNYFNTDASFERLEVFSIPQKKHVLAWKLNLAVANEQKSHSFRAEDPRLFRKAFFIEKSLVLTQMDGGRLILWKLPEAKPEWVLEGKTEIAGFTPDRSHVLLHSRDMKKFSWLELRTGEWKGDLPGDDQTTTTLAFSPDRTKFASLLTRNGYSQIVIRKIGSEEPTIFNVPGLGNSLEWLDDRYLIGLREGVVFDSENGAPVWRINFDGNVVRAPDSTCWHYGKSPGSLVLTKTIIPSDALKSKIKAIKGLPLTPLVGPGTHLAIRGGFPTDANAMQNMQQEFQRRGWVLDPNAPFGINATVTQEPSKSVEYQNLLNRQTTTVSVQGATIVTLSIAANTGLELWKSEYRSGGGYAPSMVHLRQGEDLQSKVNAHANSGTPSIYPIPDIIFPKDAYLRLTTSRMNEKGEQF